MKGEFEGGEKIYQLPMELNDSNIDDRVCEFNVCCHQSIFMSIIHPYYIILNVLSESQQKEQTQSSYTHTHFI